MWVSQENEVPAQNYLVLAYVWVIDLVSLFTGTIMLQFLLFAISRLPLEVFFILYWEKINLGKIYLRPPWLSVFSCAFSSRLTHGLTWGSERRGSKLMREVESMSRKLWEAVGHSVLGEGQESYYLLSTNNQGWRATLMEYKAYTVLSPS